MLTRFLSPSLAVLFLTAAALAGPPSGDEALDIGSIVKMAAGAKGKPGADAPSLPKFEDVTKDMESSKGLFTLWYYPESAKDKDTEKLLCQIPQSFLGEKFMLSISFSGGGFFTGFPLEERVVQWELLDRQLVLVEPETRYVVDKSKTVSDVVSRTYPERIRAAVPLVTKSKSGDPVIDLGALLKTDFADIGWMSFPMPGLAGFGRGAAINASLSKWTKKKTFPMNVEIGVELAIGTPSPPGSFDKKLVHFSFWQLPKSSYQPRIADDRVGYFLTANQDWSKPTDARDLFNRYIDRWNLEKRDPSLELCEPKQSIVFYVEKTVPVRFRRAVRDGILEWNKAYEKVGFANAVEVRQQTDDNEWKSLDPEDMRYSFFRWIVTGAGFAMGPHRANPFTGEIYDADIIFDDSMVRYFEQSAQQMLVPATAVAMKQADPALAEFFAHFPQWMRPTRDYERFEIGVRPDEARLREAMRRRMRERGHCGCDYAEGMKHQMSVAHALLADHPKEVIEQFLYDVVKEVVMHEVGHTLGLRHNFKASSIWSIDEIKERKARGEATTGSVMDYNPVLFFVDKPLDGRFVTPTIGPYDYWAIEYGYRPADGSQKPADKEGKKDEDDDKDDAKDEDEKADTDESSDEPRIIVQGEGGPANLPPEVLEKLPPEVRKMIESGAAGKLAGGPGPRGFGRKSGGGPAFTGANPAEAKMLQEIAARAAEPELAYATDEDTTILGPDPRSNRFDMGADPVDWARERIEVVSKRMDNILEWAVKDQESWYHLRQAFTRLLFEKAFVLDYVGRYIGAQHTSRAHRGDPDAPPPFTLVDVKTQKEALAFIEESLFDDDFFAVSPEVLNHLAVPRWWHVGATADYMVDYPYHDIVGVLQWWNLFDRLFPNTLRRIHDAELKTASTEKLTVAEYLQRIQNGVWADTCDPRRAKEGDFSDESPFVSSIRRSLQREYLTLIEPLVRTRPGTVVSPDLHAMVQHAVAALGEAIDKVLETGQLDFASRAHLTACQSRIKRMLEPELNELGYGGAINIGM